MSAQIREQIHALVENLDARQLLAVRLYIEELLAAASRKPRSGTSSRDDRSRY